MKVFKKCLLLFIFLMFFVVGDVKAVTFYEDGWIKFYGNLVEKGHYYTKPCRNCNYNYTYYKKESGSNNVAYCAQHKKHSPDSDTKYVEDTNYVSQYCKRIDRKTDVKCSSMVGNIIKAGNELNVNENQKYIYIQYAIQYYFYNYSNNERYKAGNDVVNGQVEKSQEIIDGILSSADSLYGKVISSTLELPDGSDIFKGSNDFDVYISSVSDKVGKDSRYSKMYYNPNTKFNNSYYLKINGPSGIGDNQVIYNVFGNDPNNVFICKVADGVCSGSAVIGLGEQFYVKTSPGFNDVKISVKASVNYKVSSDVELYDSIRYTTTNNSKQDMIVWNINKTSSDEEVNVSYVKEIKFYPQKVSEFTCGSFELDDDAGKTGTDTKGDKCVSNLVNDKCVNTTNNKNNGECSVSSNDDKKQCISNSINDIKPTAEFSGCSSSNVNIDYYVKNGNQCKKMKASAGVLLVEKGTFVYSGIISEQNPLYVGGGFELLNIDNLYTYYKNSFSYKYKYVYNNTNKLYVYYGNEYFVDDNTYVYDNASCTGTSVKAGDYFTNKLSSGTELSGLIKDLTSEFKEMFQSYDTNKESELNYVDVVNVGFKEGYSYDDVIMKSGWLPGIENERTVIYTFDLKKAYDNLKTGEIIYSDDIIDGKNYVRLDDNKNKYYTYIKYQGSKYPFNVTNANFRASKYVNYKWQVVSECDIDMGNKLFECEGNKCNLLARYRSIDVNNPFPKATTYSDIPFNWRGWYYNNSNKTRLKNTYNQYIYKLELDANNISKISADRDYTSWDNMLSNGSSEFINKDFSSSFSNKVSGNSYCELGKFSSECDK